jgi:hypothetical protein
MTKINDWWRRHADTFIRWAPLLGVVAAWLLDVGILLLLDVVAYASDCPPGGYSDCANAATTAQNPVIPGLGGLLGVGLRGVLGAPIYGPPNTGQPPVEKPAGGYPIGPASSAPGTLMPDGHTVLPPDQDPHRLTDYPDFVDWMRRTIQHADAVGGTLPPALVDLLTNPDIAALVPGPLLPAPTIIESGEVAMNRLRGLYPGRVVTAPGPDGSPGYQWVQAPRDLEGMPTGLNGVAYQPAEIVNPLDPGGPRIKVFDPNNTAIARDWPHPPLNQATSTTITAPDATTLATQLNGLVQNPTMEGYNVTVQTADNGQNVVVVPQNVPPGVQNIAYGTRTVMIGGQPTIVFDTNQPVLTTAW